MSGELKKLRGVLEETDENKVRRTK
jgi:hypothetical protein